MPVRLSRRLRCTLSLVSAILESIPLGAPPWATVDPFLFCVHHVDDYPAGDDKMGPRASLAGRSLGMDFEGKDGWRMYHGREVPGFPQHPHRGFETVTVVRKGYIDHSDSLGATARFGEGDVQWLTAGRGIVHAEMFPLRDRDAGNPLELFQIWLNLPAAGKMVEPYFSMLWGGDIPVCTFTDDAGRATSVTVVAGRLDGRRPPPPPPNSWAAQPDSDLAIWTLQLAPGARWELPRAQGDRTVRTLYVFGGDELRVAGERFEVPRAIMLNAAEALVLEAGPTPVDALLLQGRPIGEPVAHYGPFVMNTEEEVRQAMRDYQQTQFGGWPWPSDGPVHSRERGRFARYVDGRVEEGR
ncbi:pirin family protein [Haliangium sp.]|uniref:pirin family protein n=1 Tax=Haliangium sp. TaxID=2663208 RepID=UPI003D0FD814